MPSLGPLTRPLRILRRSLPPLNFLTAHWLYFILTSLLSALIFWGASTPFRSISFTDSLFLTVSAMTLAGLNTINLSAINTFQQVMLFLLIMLGSAIFVSAFVVHVRKKAFERTFRDVQDGRRRFARVRTWATRRGGGDEEAVVGKRGDGTKETEGDDGGEALDRVMTPPERRGGPEMNRTASYAAEHAFEEEKDLESSTAEAPNGHAEKPTKDPAITFRNDTRFGTTTTSTPNRHPLNRRFSLQGVGARPTTTLAQTTSFSLPQNPPSSSNALPTDPNEKISRYFDTASGWLSRNSQFHNLTPAEREKLGGYEYRAIELLAWLVPAYFIAWQLLGCIGCAAWVALNDPGAARVNALNPWWVGAFNAVSAFNNSGMSLVDANMVAFQRSYYLLLTMGLLILAGNTAYPIFLRLIVWGMWRVAAWRAAREADAAAEGEEVVPGREGEDDGVWEERSRTLRFLLDHPRRCYTTLFPSQHTWWLALSVFTLNAIDWAAFEILNIGNEHLSDGLPLRFRVIDGLFQAFAVRSGGFYVVTIATLRISLLVLYVVMMYISVYPVVITMRNSNVYEERSLGIYAEDNNTANADDPATSSSSALNKPPLPRRTTTGTRSLLLHRARTLTNHLTSLSPAAPLAAPSAPEPENNNFIRHQLRAQLAYDVWFLILALWLITLLETSNFNNAPEIFSVFNIAFEIVSAYGCVGISVGVPYAAYSFSGAWNTTSKLVLCAVMLRGRHRGLPVAIDKGVLLPGEALGRAEEEDGRIRGARTIPRVAPEVAIG